MEIDLAIILGGGYRESKGRRLPGGAGVYFAKFGNHEVLLPWPFLVGN